MSAPFLDFHKWLNGTSPWPVCWTAAVNPHPRKCYPNCRPTQKHPSPSVDKLLPNKSLSSTSQVQRAIISPTTGALAMVPPATLCEAISLHEGGMSFFHFFNLEGFVHIPRLTPLQYAKGASTPGPPTGWCIQENNFLTGSGYEKTDLKSGSFHFSISSSHLHITYRDPLQ